MAAPEAPKSVNLGRVHENGLSDRSEFSSRISSAEQGLQHDCMWWRVSRSSILKPWDSLTASKIDIGRIKGNMSEEVVEQGKMSLTWLESQKIIQQMYKKECLPGTGSWLWAHASYRKWMDAKGPACLWLHGVPGSGKSTITSAIVDNLLEHERKRGVVCFFFGDRGLHRLDAPRHILKALIYQLVDHQNPTVPEPLLRSILREIDTIDSPILQEAFRSCLRAIFVGLLPQARIFLVFDGLDVDEWIEDIMIHETIQANISDKRPTLLRCIISSRTQHTSVVHQDQVTQISLGNEPGARCEILQFAEARLAGLLKYPLGKTESAALLAAELCSCPQRVPLWVSLVTESLSRGLGPNVQPDHSDCPVSRMYSLQQNKDLASWEGHTQNHTYSLAELRNEFASLPSDLDGVYQKLMERIQNSCHSEIARKIFFWLSAASRPMKIGELQEALATRIGPRSSATELELDLPHPDFDLVRTFAPLLTVTDENVVTFRHSSLREYLFPDALKPRWAGYSMTDAHELLAQTCLAVLNARREDEPYLLWDDPHIVQPDQQATLSFAQEVCNSAGVPLSQPSSGTSSSSAAPAPTSASTASTASSVAPSTSPSAVSQVRRSNPSNLKQYAAVNWPLHYRLAESQSMVLPGILQRFLNISLMSILGRCSESESGNSVRVAHTILRICAFYGFSSLTRMYLEMGTSPDGNSCPYCETPLQIAASRGHFETVALLLERGASANTDTTVGGKDLLYLACQNGSTKIVKLLLERSGMASEDERGRDKDRTSLHAAATSGHVDVVQLLIDYGADVNAQIASTNDTPLHLAATHGHLQTIKRLIDGRNCSNKELQLYDSIVQQPYYQSWSDVMLNDVDKDGRFVWEWEMRCSAEEYLRELLSYSTRYADINSKDHLGRTPLHLAALNGSEAVVRFLLERAAKPEVQDNMGYTPLQAAVGNGHLAVVKLLLTHGSQMNTTLEAWRHSRQIDSKTWGLVLEKAAQKGHHSVADLLMWSFFSTDVAGGACKWPVLSLATKSKRRTVQDALYWRCWQGGKAKLGSHTRLSLRKSHNEHDETS